MQKLLLLLLTFLLLLSGCGKPAASSETVYLFPEDNIPDVTSNNFYTLFSYSETSSDVTYSYPQENPPYIGWGKEYKGYIYCQDADTSKLYRYKPDGSELSLVNEEISDEFYLEDGWIYYRTYNEQSEYQTICRMRLDGTESSVVVEKILYGSDFIMNNGTLFYIDPEGNSLCRMKTDGSEFIRMKTDGICQFYIKAGFIYYESGTMNKSGKTEAIYRMSLGGTGKKKLYDGTVYLFVVAEDWIFINNDDPESDSPQAEQYILWKIPVSGGEAVGVMKENGYVSDYYNGRIYYEDQNSNLYSMDITTGDNTRCIDAEDTAIEWHRFSGDWFWYLTRDRASGKPKLNKMRLDGSEYQQLDVPLMLPIETDYSYYFEADPYLGNWTFIKTLGEDPAAFGASVIGSGIVIDKKRYIQHTDSCENPVYSFQDSSMDELAKAGVPTAELQADKVVRVTVTSTDFESSFWVLDNTFIIFLYHDGKTFCVAEKTSNIPTNLDNIGRIFARYYKESMTSIVTYYGNWTGKGTWGYGYTPQEGGRDLSDAHISLSQEVYRVGNQMVENPSYKITPVSRSSIREGAGSFAYEMTMGFESPSAVCVMVCASTEDAASGKYVDRFWVINNEEIVFQGSSYYRAVRE